MTRQRIFAAHLNAFSEWLRKQEDLDSTEHHFYVTDVDFVIQCESKWMLIETKRNNGEMRWNQSQIFKKLHSAIRDINYRGFHLIQFQNTSPDDGEIHLDKAKISKDDLLAFLRFMGPDEWYERNILE